MKTLSMTLARGLDIIGYEIHPYNYQTSNNINESMLTVLLCVPPFTPGYDDIQEIISDYMENEQ